MKDLWKLLAVGAALVAWLMLAWFAGVWLHLEGSNRIILVAGLALVGIIAAAAFLYWSRDKQVGATPAGAQAAPKASDVLGKAEKDEIDLLIRQAEQNLRSSQVVRGASIAKLPVVLLIGEAGAGKTTTMLKSGLEPEALAGQATQEESIVPTPWANLWFTRNTVFVETGNKVVKEAPPWARVVRLVAPAKLGSVLGKKSTAARAAVVCVDCEPFTKPDSGQALLSSARNLRARLAEMSQLLGISFPVYVLFAKADRIKFFDDYVKNFSNPEIAQVFGATLPLQSSEVGIYAEQQTKRVSGAFDDLFHSLSDKRTEFLPREYGADRWPAVYEFPREFRKLQTPVLQFLVELCRPSQLSVGPFLRGFYFTGRRTVVVEMAASSRPQPSSAPDDMPDESPGATHVFDRRNRIPATAAQPAEEIPEGATRVFDARKPIPEGTLAGGTLVGGTFAGGTFLGGFTAAAPPVTRTEQQWAFLSHLFSDVILQDRAALGASGASSKVSFWQRFLLVAVAVIFLVCCVGFTVSYFGNRALISDVSGAQAAPFGELAANQAPTPSDLKHLDDIGQVLDTLGGYHQQGAPLRLRWGLYVGDDLYQQACRAYSRSFNKLLLGPTQASMVAYLRALSSPVGQVGPAGHIGAVSPSKNATPPTPPIPPYNEPYNKLKTYLISAGQGNHIKEDSSFASDLYANWPPGQSITGDEEKLARSQFDRYAAQLAGGDTTGCFPSTPQSNAVGNARNYLNSLPPEQRIYQAMLSDAASKGGKDIIFNRDFGGSDIVINTYPVRPEFTKHGWDGMQDALQHPERYRGGERWVLGDQTKEVADPQTYVSALQQRYQQDDLNEWRSMIKSSRFVGYKGPADVVPKIDKIAGAQSPLLMVLCVAVNNTAVGDKGILNAFSVPRSAVPPDCESKVTGPPNKDYTDSLFGLQTCLQKAGLAASPQDQATARAQCQPTSIDAEGTVRKLVAQNAGPDTDVNNAVQNLLLAPIQSEALQSQMKPPPPPGAGDLCKGLSHLSAGFPDTVTLDEFEGVFRPNDGLLGKFKPPTEKANPRYVSFYNTATAIQRALYPDGKTLQLNYSVTALSSPGVNSFNLTIGNQSLTAIGISKDFVWSGTQGDVQLVANGNAPVGQSGPFAIFKFVAVNADRGQLSGGKYTFPIPVVVGRETPTSPRLKLTIEAGAATVLFKGSAWDTLGCVAKVGV
ncbi:MAG: ImcF-related family protein [Terriglobia bacterium]